MMDVSDLGVIAAELMDRLSDDYDPEAEIGVVAVIAEITYTDDEGDECTAIEYRCSDGRRWLQLGLFTSALRAVTASSVSPED